jgi:acyl-CoA thioesterase FadM
MNVMWYVGKFDEANWNFLATLGLTPTYFGEQHRGMAAVQQNIAYKHELLAGNIVEVRSRALEIGDKSLCLLATGRSGLCRRSSFAPVTARGPWSVWLNSLPSIR